MKKTGILLALLLMLAGAAQAQQAADTTYVFRFPQGSDMFYVPYRGNGAELARLGDSLSAHRALLTDSLMFISIASYAAAPGDNLTARQMAYLRASRVKSELILRGLATEQMFATERHLPQAYGPDSLRDVVVVTLPADLHRVERLLGTEATARIRQQQELVHREAEQQRLEAERRQEEAERQRLAAEQQQREAEQRRLAEEQQRQAEERQRLQAESETPDADTFTPPHPLALRFNLLRWATMTADLGVEYRPLPRLGILVEGSFANWGWKDKSRRYRLWEVTPEVRYYLGRQARGYLGALYKTGEYNYKLADTGKKGDLWSTALSGGYELRLASRLGLDFHAAVGYTRAEYDKYTRIDGVNVRYNKNGSLVKNRWGVTHLGVSLVWRPFDR